MLKIVCTFAPEIKNHIQMKDKILNALKQEYAHLGLGEGILSGLAEMLAGTKLVTDENLQGIVAGQKVYLEDLQKSNDKMVQDAVTKTQNEANTKAESAKTEHAAAIAKVQKELDDYKAAHPDKQPVTPPAEDKNTPEWYKKEKVEREKREKEWQDKLDAIEKAKNESDKKLKDFEDAKTKEDAARAAAARKEAINSKAKAKGIPDWMIAHGFADITDDADDAKIDEILTKYANEIKTNFLPTRNGIPQFGNKEVTKADTDGMVAKLFPSEQKK